MTNPEDEALVDIRISFTKEQCAAKMLGWMKGHIRQKYVRVTLNGVSADQLPYLHSLDWPLQEQLQELREAARIQFIQAVESGATFEEIRTKEEAVTEADHLINQAATYLLDIDDEIAKGEESDLKIDHPATQSSGNIHITIRSLDRWAREKYGKQILLPSPFGMSSVIKGTANTKTAQKPRQKMREQEQAILDQIRKLEYQPNALPKNEPGKKGVKSKVKEALVHNPFFDAKSAFKRAWDQLREDGTIKENE